MFENPQTSLNYYGIEEFKEALQLGGHYTDRSAPLSIMSTPLKSLDAQGYPSISEFSDVWCVSEGGSPSGNETPVYF